jgi:hypothetical protein
MGFSAFIWQNLALLVLAAKLLAAGFEEEACACSPANGLRLLMPLENWFQHGRNIQPQPQNMSVGCAHLQQHLRATILASSLLTSRTSIVPHFISASMPQHQVQTKLRIDDHMCTMAWLVANQSRALTFARREAWFGAADTSIF